MWETELCRDYTVESLIYFYSVQTPFEEARFSIPMFTCECDTVEYCNFRPGFWKNHPDAMPAEILNVGCESYTESELIVIPNTPIKHDKLPIMTHHLIAAKLTVLTRSDDSIQGAIDDGDVLICATSRIFGGVNRDVKSDLIDIANLLVGYNEMGCPGEGMDDFGILGSRTPQSAPASSAKESSWSAIKKMNK
jgi:hypothetical protein